jgi:hypothetical protein
MTHLNNFNFYHYAVGNIEYCNAEVSASEAVAMSLCIDSGATHVVTPQRYLLSNYAELPETAGSVKLASESSTRVVRHSIVTLRSRATGSTLPFTDVLHVSSARSTHP